MFKKTVLFILVISPLLFTLCFGYPVKTNSKIGISQRTYETNNEQEYLRALKTQPRINRMMLVKSINQKLTSYSPWFQTVWIIALLALALIWILL